MVHALSSTTTRPPLAAVTTNRSRSGPAKHRLVGNVGSENYSRRHSRPSGSNTNTASASGAAA